MAKLIRKMAGGLLLLVLWMGLSPSYAGGFDINQIIVKKDPKDIKTMLPTCAGSGNVGDIPKR